MKIRIVKAIKSTYWYANKIGEVFEVVDDISQSYRLRVEGGYRFVSKADVEEVIEHNSQLYRKVDRPVREGDTVLITRYNGELIYDIEEVSHLGICDDRNFYFGYGSYLEYGYDEYFVLELVKQSQPTWDEIGERIHAELEAKLLQTENESHSYAEVSELLHEAKVDFNEGIDELTEKYDNTLRNLSDDVIEHNGKQYRKVKRKAAVGDLVVITAKEENWDDYNIGDIYEVNSLFGSFAILNAQWSDGSDMNILDREYHVLEPIEQSGQTELDLIANLAKEVTELKRQLTNAATDIADLEDRVDENEKDTEELIGRINDLGDGAKAEAVDFKALIESLTKMMFDSRDAADYYRERNLPQTALYQRGISRGVDAAITKIEGALRNG